jgi:hypothetical protein
MEKKKKKKKFLFFLLLLLLRLSLYEEWMAPPTSPPSTTAAAGPCVCLSIFRTHLCPRHSAIHLAVLLKSKAKRMKSGENFRQISSRP